MPHARLALAALVALLVVAVAGPAGAHSQLLTIDPADGASMKEGPAQVVLTFNEDIKAPFSKILVVDQAGGSVADGDPKVEGPVVTQPLVKLAKGTYTVRYRVVSADAHPISGESTFSVTVGAPGTTPTPAQSGSASKGVPSGVPVKSATWSGAAKGGSGFSGTTVLLLLAVAALAGVAGALVVRARRGPGGSHRA